MNKIYSFYKKGKEVELYFSTYYQVWYVIVNNKLTQKSLSHKEVIGYLCNAAHDGSDNANP